MCLETAPPRSSATPRWFACAVGRRTRWGLARWSRRSTGRSTPRTCTHMTHCSRRHRSSSDKAHSCSSINEVAAIHSSTRSIVRHPVKHVPRTGTYRMLYFSMLLVVTVDGFRQQLGLTSLRRDTTTDDVHVPLDVIICPLTLSSCERF